MKYRFQVHKRAFDIETAPNSTFQSETPIRVEKTPFQVQIAESRDNEILSFFVNRRIYQVEIERDLEGYPSGIYVNEEYYPASLLKIDKLFYFKPRPQRSTRSGLVKSFIPGYIQKVFFQTGESVQEGDIVLIHEAMKMENEIRAPISGIIKTMGVKEGDNVLANRLLFEIE